MAELQLAQDLEAALAGQQQVEDHAVVVAGEGPLEPLLPVGGDVHHEALGLERAGQERADSCLVLDDQYSHVLHSSL